MPGPLAPSPKRDPRPLWRKKGGGWYFYASFYDPARRPARKEVASGINGGDGEKPTKEAEDAAADWMTDVRRQWRRGEVDPWEGYHRGDGVTYAEAVEKYFRSSRQLRKTTASMRRATLGAFGRSLPHGIALGHVEARHVRAFLDRPSRRPGPKGEDVPLAPRTRHGYLGTLQYFFAWCRREGLIRDDPCADVQLRPLGRRLPEFLTPREFERFEVAAAELLAKALEPGRGRVRDRDVVWILDPCRLALATGLRLGDVCRLEWSRVRRDAGVILVDDRTKSGNEYAVPILRLAAEVLDRQRAEYDEMGGAEGFPDGLVFHSPYPDEKGRWRALSRGNVQRKVREVRDKAGLGPEVSFHTLRHTFATWMLMQTGNLRLVSAMLGHASTAQTERYAHVALLAQRQIAEADFERLGVSWREYAGEGSALAITAAFR